MTLKSKMLLAVSLMNEGKTNPEIAEHLKITKPQVGYLLNQARQSGFKLERNYSTREREKRRAG